MVGREVSFDLDDGRVTGKIVSFDKASKWWVQFDDAKCLVHRQNIRTVDVL